MGMDFPSGSSSDPTRYYREWSTPPYDYKWIRNRTQILARSSLTSPDALPKVFTLPTSGYRSYQVRISGMGFNAPAQPYLEMSTDGTTFALDSSHRWDCLYMSPTGYTHALGTATGVSSRGALLGAAMWPTGDSQGNCMAVVDIYPGSPSSWPTCFVASREVFPANAYYEMWLSCYRVGPGPVKAIRLVAYNSTPAVVNFSRGYYDVIGYP